jgi:hypothetical protein
MPHTKSRAGRTVVVDGYGSLAAEVSAQLRRCDVTVRAGAYASLAAELCGGDQEAPSAVVLVAHGAVPAWAGSTWHAAVVPHLPVGIGESTLVVGPLIVPGITACLACAAAAGPVDRPPPHRDIRLTGETVLAAAIATVTILTLLHGDTSLGGISTEICLRETTVVHRLWTARADCRCGSSRLAG